MSGKELVNEKERNVNGDIGTSAFWIDRPVGREVSAGVSTMAAMRMRVLRQ